MDAANMDTERWRQHRQQTALRHLAKYRQLAEAHSGIDGVSILQAEHDNLQTAVAHAWRQQHTEALQYLTWTIGRPFDGYLSLNGHWVELESLLQKSIGLSEMQN